MTPASNVRTPTDVTPTPIRKNVQTVQILRCNRR